MGQCWFGTELAGACVWVMSKLRGSFGVGYTCTVTVYMGKLILIPWGMADCYKSSWTSCMYFTVIPVSSSSITVSTHLFGTPNIEHEAQRVMWYRILEVRMHPTL